MLHLNKKYWKNKLTETNRMHFWGFKKKIHHVSLLIKQTFVKNIKNRHLHDPIITFFYAAFEMLCTGFFFAPI